MEDFKMIKTNNSFGILIKGMALVFVCAFQNIHAANIALVGNGAASGPIISTSTFGDIALGVRLRVGTFTDSAALNSAISNFKDGSKTYLETVAALNAVFTDLGTNVTNFGNASQVGTGVSSTQFVFNTTASLTVNGTTASHNVFTGSIASVAYSSSIGYSKSVYVWTAYNSEIGIFRDSVWTTPVSDLTALTLNLNGITAASAATEILLGGYQDYASGTDLLTLATTIPEPSSLSLFLGGCVILAGLNRKSNRKV